MKITSAYGELKKRLDQPGPNRQKDKDKQMHQALRIKLLSALSVINPRIEAKDNESIGFGSDNSSNKGFLNKKETDSN